MNKKIAIGAAIVVAALAAALALSPPVTHASPGGPGTFNDWIATVCVPGTFKEGGSGGGPAQPHATDRGGCVANADTEPIFIGRYASTSDAAYDLTHLSGYYHTNDLGGFYTAAQMSDGTGIQFVAPRPLKAGPVPQNALYPLTTFGFDVQRIPPQA